MPVGSYTAGAIILLSDGRRTSGPDPLDIARRAADLGVRVHTVAFGTADGVIPGLEGYSFYARVDEETLQAVAKTTGGEFYRASNAEDLGHIYDKLSSQIALETRLTEVSVLFAALALAGCGYNDFQRLDEQTTSAWSEVLNQYQRRADLVPNLVATVKGEANFEQETLTRVIEARAKATSIQVTPETLNNPEAMQKFQAAQGELGSALSRLLVVSENYPNLKTNQGFADLRVQLEGTENRITVARNRYIKAVQDYNVLSRSFPSNLTAMVFGYKPKANFSVANEAAISAPPKVDFAK